MVSHTDGSGSTGFEELQLPTLTALIGRVEAWHPDGDPVARIMAAVEVAESLGDVADHLVGHFVDAARAGGASWAQIGVGLGVSKQAVQQRFVPREPATVADFAPHKQRFSRFTQRSLHVVKAAGEVAAGTGGTAVGPMHILVGLFAEPEGLAVRAMVALGASPDEVRALAVAELPPVDPMAGQDGGALPFTAEGRKVFDLSVREALALGHNYVGTEHLLLALLAEDESETARLLSGFGVTRERFLEEFHQIMAEHMSRSKNLLGGRKAPKEQ